MIGNPNLLSCKTFHRLCGFQVESQYKYVKNINKIELRKQENKRKVECYVLWY